MVALVEKLMGDLAVLALLAALALTVFWLAQFVGLMLLKDTDFPGRSDKPLWVAVFVVFSVLAPFAFAWWKWAREVQREAAAAGRPDRPPHT